MGTINQKCHLSLTSSKKNFSVLRHRWISEFHHWPCQTFQGERCICVLKPLWRTIRMSTKLPLTQGLQAFRTPFSFCDATAARLRVSWRRACTVQRGWHKHAVLHSRHGDTRCTLATSINDSSWTWGNTHSLKSRIPWQIHMFYVCVLKTTNIY